MCQVCVRLLLLFVLQSHGGADFDCKLNPNMTRFAVLSGYVSLPTNEVHIEPICLRCFPPAVAATAVRATDEGTHLLLWYLWWMEKEW